MTDKKTVLVTGASGFLGRHVCAELLSHGWKVRGLVRDGGDGALAGIDLYHGDLDNQTVVRRATEGAWAVVHLAARVHVMGPDPLAEFRRVNVAGTEVVLEESQRAHVERFVFTSSVKAVGESNTTTWTEDVTPRPLDPYGISKLEAERLVARSPATNGFSHTILRLPLAYGPRVGGNMARLFALVDRGIPLPLGGIVNRRSLVFSGNVAAAISSVLCAHSVGSEVFFVADDETLSTPELIQRIAEALARRAFLLPVPEELLRAVARGSEKLSEFVPVPRISGIIDRLLDSLTVSSAKLTRLTGFRPPYSVTEGLRQTAAWYRSQ